MCQKKCQPLLKVWKMCVWISLPPDALHPCQMMSTVASLTFWLQHSGEESAWAAESLACFACVPSHWISGQFVVFFPNVQDVAKTLVSWRLRHILWWNWNIKCASCDHEHVFSPNYKNPRFRKRSDLYTALANGDRKQNDSARFKTVTTDEGYKGTCKLYALKVKFAKKGPYHSRLFSKWYITPATTEGYVEEVERPPPSPIMSSFMRTIGYF